MRLRIGAAPLWLRRYGRQGLSVLLVCLGFVLVGLVLIWTGPALATSSDVILPPLNSYVVGDGTPESCTESAFATAFADAQRELVVKGSVDAAPSEARAQASGDGLVTFNCGGPATITFTSQKVASATVSVDGGDLITLSGANATRLFDVAGTATLTLRRITLSHGYSGNDSGGAVVVRDSGRLIVDGSRILDSQTGLARGGGIATVTATSAATVTNSEIAFNRGNDGGGIFNLGQLTIVDSRIYSNTAVNIAGGGINNAGQLTITGSRIYSNTAPGDFTDSGGGGVDNSGTATIERTTIDGNRALLFGAVGNRKAGVITLRNSSVVNNPVSGITSDGIQVTVINSTIAGNNGLGLAVANGRIDVDYSTVARNSAANLYVDPNPPQPAMSFASSLVELGPCVSTYNGIASRGHNVVNRQSCQLQDVSDRYAADLGLGPIQDNGGETPSMALLPGSPAIDSGSCPPNNPPTDQRGATRSIGLACDSGAYETGAIPTLVSLDPATALAGSSAVTLTADGRDFLPGTLLLWNDASRPTTVVSATRLTAVLAASDLASAGTARVIARYGSAPDGASSSLPFTVAKRDQTIDFPTVLDHTLGDAPFAVTVSASSGLPVSLAASGPCTVSGTTVTLTGGGTCTLTASQAGDGIYNPAPSVSRDFQIAASGPTSTPTPLGAPVPTATPLPAGTTGPRSYISIVLAGGEGGW